MKKSIVIIAAALLFSMVSFAGEKNTSELTGKVMESVNGVEVPVAFAYVYCEGTTISAYTNGDGEFVLPVAKHGKYKLRFSHAGYAVVEKEVRVKKNATQADCSISRQEVMLTQL